jgi:hypothetical protein
VESGNPEDDGRIHYERRVIKVSAFWVVCNSILIIVGIILMVVGEQKAKDLEARKLPSDFEVIKLGCTVQEVTWKSERVQVSCGDRTCTECRDLYR